PFRAASAGSAWSGWTRQSCSAFGLDGASGARRGRRLLADGRVMILRGLTVGLSTYHNFSLSRYPSVAPAAPPAPAPFPRTEDGQGPAPGVDLYHRRGRNAAGQGGRPE